MENISIDEVTGLNVDNSLTIEFFKNLARKSKSPEKFIEKAKEICGVPTSVKEEFYSKYSPDYDNCYCSENIRIAINRFLNECRKK
jgi:hypothetical protein